MRDSQGRIWAATNEGAICFDVKHQDRHVIYDQRQGMSNIHVRAIIEDEMHNIWMSTNRGISCLKAGQAGRFINFNEKDNVVKANFNDGSVARSEQGIIYFGSAQGLCCFQPRQVLSVSRAPEPIITSLRLIRGIEQTDSVINLAIRNHISLAYDENSFAVNFTVRNFAMENHVEYSYMLSGLQNDWITAQYGTITLRDIPPGTYQLQVRARFHNQPWSSEIAEFTIIVRPPFWLSWWAKLCYTLFVLAIVYLALRIYQRHLRLKFELKAEKVHHEKEQKLNEERLRFFTNITHELRTPLTLILGPLDDISHSSDITKTVKHKLAVIHQSAVRLNELITQILEFRKTETDNRQLRVVKANVVDAVLEVSLKYEELAQKKEQLRESLNKIDQEFFDKLNKLIEENISGDVDVNLIASNLAVSTSTLYRKMKALTGISTNEYIRKYKMQYAEHLLLEGKYSISEISFMVGMNSVAYFRRCFKAEYGEIPSEYLKKLQKM